MSVVLGAVADDFTGATDLANTLVKAGMRTVQLLGPPGPDTDAGDAEAVVVALKSRTAPLDEAVPQSLAALDWLRARGARQIVFKYCSTFDSTETGNIGPVADALMAALGTDFALVCPAFPGAGRTIYKGVLFVGDQPLAESPMKDHPLTPMRDSNLVRLMAAQSARRVGLIAHEAVRAGPAAVAARIAALKAEGVAYGVIDALTDEDLAVIGRAAADHALVTGGSGVAQGLPANLRAQGALGAAEAPRAPAAAGRAMVIAGSCSVATRAQIDRAAEIWPVFRVDVDALAEGKPVAKAAAAWALDRPADQPVVIYASAPPEEVRAAQARHGVAAAGALVEACLGEAAAALAARGFDRVVVAGGETSGAVVSALGVTALRIGPEIAPGVPWTEALGGPPLALALKSGNFGGPRFFEEAFAALS